MARRLLQGRPPGTNLFSVAPLKLTIALCTQDLDTSYRLGLPAGFGPNSSNEMDEGCIGRRVFMIIAPVCPGTLCSCTIALLLKDTTIDGGKGD